MTTDKTLDIELHNLFGNRFISNANLVQHYSRNLGGFIRSVKAVVKPHNSKEIQALIGLANKHLCSLYPVSTGKNWGLGSSLPVKNEAIIVDLSEMNNIEINERHAYALIGPGVTQGQLYDYIQKRHLPFLINVTGSGRETSLLGNALDRGDGYFNLRSEDIKGLEVVLGNGKMLKTGFGHYKNAQGNYLYPDGVGPSMNGLFSQSNFGIVTKAAFALVPKCEMHAAVICGLEDDAQFSSFIDAIATLRQQKVWSSIIHIGNKERSRSTLLPILTDFYQEHKNISFETARPLALQTMQKEMNNAWTGVGSISGTTAQVKAAFKAIQKKLIKYGRVALITDQKINRLKKRFKAVSYFPFFERKYAITQAIEPLFAAAQGIPTDQALKSLYWESGAIPKKIAQPTETSAGILFTLPLIPLDGKHAVELVNITLNNFTKHGFKTYITLNTFNAHTLGAVINLLFDKNNPDETIKAKGCIAEMNYLYREKGFLPYRVSIDGMTDITDPNDTFWQTVQDLKKVLDPNGIISPGRYNLS